MTKIMHRGRAAALFIAAALALSFIPSQSAQAVRRETIGCIPIRNAAQLQAMRNNLAGIYCLVRDIDAGPIANFIPIGDSIAKFTGRLYGNGYVVKNLTIANTTAQYAGLFGVAGEGAVIQDIGLVDVDVSSNVTAGYVGALLGSIQVGVNVANVTGIYVTGRVKCLASSCVSAGLIGSTIKAQIVDVWSSAAVTCLAASCSSAGLIGNAEQSEISDARSSAAVSGRLVAAGLIGTVGNDTTVRDSYATGHVTCNDGGCTAAGGFAGQSTGTSVEISDSFATGDVRCGTCIAGGFAGLVDHDGVLNNVYATGAVTGATAGGLTGLGTQVIVIASFAAGPVQGTSAAGGLIGDVVTAPFVGSCYWDTDTTGQMTSAAGACMGRTTAQLRNALPVGFAVGTWGISKNLSYPFLNRDGFSSNLATLVRANKIYTALPIKQSDKSQYIGNPKHVVNASLATVYTMVARAIGQTLGIGQLDNVKIDRYFWLDATQATIFRGPVKQHATLGAMMPIAPATPLKPANVIGKLNQGNWVVLRGSYTKPGGGLGTHYMLATLFTRQGTGVALVIANDPATGEQVAIDPSTKRVVIPRGFPLAGFKVNGYATISNIH